MRFEPYQETKKTVKVAPVRIVQNQHDQNGSQPQTTKYPQLNLQFQFQKCFTPAVTIPLSFLQQLIQQAQSNKILNQIGENKTVQQEQSEAVNNLITQIQYQKQGTSKSQDSNEDSPIRLYLIKSQMKFITEDTTSIDKVKLYFADNQNLLPHFWAWINSIEFKALEEMLMLCYSNPSNTKRIQDIFKSLFKLCQLNFQKHAYAQILRSNLQDKIKYLSVIGDILSKIMNPQDYFYFNKQ